MKPRTNHKQHGLGTRSLDAGQHSDQDRLGRSRGYQYRHKQNPAPVAHQSAAWRTRRAPLPASAPPSALATAATALDLLDMGSQMIALDVLYRGGYCLSDRAHRRSARFDVAGGLKRARRMPERCKLCTPADSPGREADQSPDHHDPRLGACTQLQAAGYLRWAHSPARGYRVPKPPGVRT